MKGFMRCRLSLVAVVSRRWFNTILVAAFSLLIAASSISSNASNPLAVWIADNKTLKGVDTETNQFVKAINLDREAVSAAVDPRDNSIWTLQNKQLVQFNQEGQALRRIDLTLLSHALGTPKVIALDPYDGSLWVTSDAVLLHVSSSGAKLLEWVAPNAIQAFDLDIDESAWILTKKQLIHLSLAGTVLATADLKNYLSDPEKLAIDNLGGFAWIANNRKLLQFNLNNLPQILHSINFASDRDGDNDNDDGTSPPRIKTLNAHPFAGTVWLVSRNTFYFYDRQGALLKTIDLSPYQLGKIKTIAYDPMTPALWLGGKNALGRFTIAGDFVARLPVDKSAVVIAVAPFKLSPTLSLIDPPDNALTNNPRPTVRLGLGSSCSGVPCVLPDSYIRSLTFDVTLNGQAIGPLFMISGNEATFTPSVRLPEGLNSLVGRSKDLFGHRSETIAGSFIVDTIAPQFIALTPADGSVVTVGSVTISGQVDDPAANVILSDASGAGISMGGASFSFAVLLSPGANSFTLTARDAAGNTTTLPLRLTYAPIPLQLTVSSPTDGAVVGEGAINVSGSVQGPPGMQVTVNGVSAAVSGSSFTTQNIALAEGANTLTIIAKAPDGRSLTQTLKVTRQSGPPDPVTVAPPIDRTVATTLSTATAFIYSGANPIQTGVAPGTIEPKRAAVVRGKVMTRDNAPLLGVQITILSHPEFGQTQSRADGAFDMAVNGGGVLTVNYTKSGYLPAQRQVNVPWQDYVHAPDVILIPLDPQVTTIDLTSAVPMQVARGSVVTDPDGTRQATILFPQGTTATMFRPDGSTQMLTTLSARATEYTVGSNGSKAMPAPLPPTSAYTYAVELSVDEALAQGVKVGGKDVVFNQPVPVYVDNFLNFKVGENIPVGYYDRDKVAWIPYDNGRVVKIVGISNGLALLDINGDGAADDAAALTTLGVSDAERQRLATLYPIDRSLWRTALTHFSTWDINPGWYIPADAAPPQLPDISNDPKNKPEDDPECKPGSVIECENQVLNESLGVTGTSYRLHYSSDRVTGRKAAYTIDVPLSVDTVPSGTVRIDLELTIAGRKFVQSFPPTPNQRYMFTWDGFDAYGRLLQGKQALKTSVGYVYRAVYQGAPGFASRPTVRRVDFGSLTRGEITYWTHQAATIGLYDVKLEALGAWTLNVHHRYDLGNRTLHLGDGSRRESASVVRSVAGNGNRGGAGGLVDPALLVTAPDGTIYFTETSILVTRHIHPDGRLIRSFGGTVAQSMAIGHDGSVYIGEPYVVKRIAPDGAVSIVAGMAGSPGYAGDGGLATQARLNNVLGLAVAPDGTIYINDGSNERIRRVSPDGIIETILGPGRCVALGDGGLASQASLCNPSGMAVASDGSLYIADTWNNRIRRIGPDGVITTVAGSGPNGNFGGYSGDGGPATSARLFFPRVITVANDGSLYFSDDVNHRIRRIGPDGIIRTVGGTGVGGYNGEGRYVTETHFGTPNAPNVFNGTTSGLAFSPNGDLYIADYGNQRVRRAESMLPPFNGASFAIGSESGDEIYEFDSTGRHLRTRNAFTGAVRYSFVYDAAGLLVQVVDGDGNVTTIERGGGQTVAIVAPDLQRTTLSMDTNGYLAAVANSAGEVTRATYDAQGLMATFARPRGNASIMTYDLLGRLRRDQNAAGGFWELTRTEHASGYSMGVVSALNRTTTYDVDRLASDELRRRTTQPDGTQTQKLFKTTGTTTTMSADGTVTTVVEAADPRFRMESPIVGNQTTTTPGGLTFVTSRSRTISLSDPVDILSLVSQTDTVSLNGKTTINVFNAATKQHSTTTPTGRQKRTMIDSQGRPTQIEITGISPIVYSYDPRGRLTAITQGSGADTRNTTVSYNAQGFVSSMVDAENRTQSFTYDNAGRVKTQTLPDGRVIQWNYDANGNIVGLTPPGRPRHSFNYTAVDLEDQYTPPAVSGITDPRTLYTYNLDKQLTAITRPDGQTVDFNYDAGGRLSTITLPGRTIAHGYSATTGQLTSVNTSQGQNLSYTYDGFLPITESWSGPIAGSLTRTYNNDFLTNGISVNGTDIPFSYDNDGLLTQVGSLAINRDAQNGLITGTVLSTVTTSQSYNSFGEVNRFTANQSGSTVLDIQYTRDTMGRITHKTETTGGSTDTFTYSYDAAGRLTQVQKNSITQASYDYDANGNRLTKTTSGGTISGTYDDQDRLLTYGNNSYTYTANGELKTKTNAGQTTNYAYDALGNLTNVTLPDGTTVEYVIDGRNRRVGKRVNGTFVQGLLYQDELRPIAELDGSGNITARFVYGTKINVPDYIVKSNTTYRVISDHLGSPRLIINTTNGNIEQRLDYDEFGNVTTDTNPGFQSFGFAGGLYDRDTNLTRFGARDYDPETGRWTTKDPIKFEGGDSNLFRYVAGDPINEMDPYGLLDPSKVEKLIKAYERLDNLDKAKTGAQIIKQIHQETDARTEAERRENAVKIARICLEMGLSPIPFMPGFPEKDWEDLMRKIVEGPHQRMDRVYDYLEKTGHGSNPYNQTKGTK